LFGLEPELLASEKGTNKIQQLTALIDHVQCSK